MNVRDPSSMKYWYFFPNKNIVIDMDIWTQNIVSRFNAEIKNHLTVP